MDPSKIDPSMLEGITYPFYSLSVILPVLAAITIVLDIPPLIWHFSQRNMATTSVIIWVILLNICSLVNPILWPRDNILQWYDGNVLCDIESRIIVGSWVALPGGVACILRRLANVLDTKNIVVAPSRSNRIREAVFELLWCWLFPILAMVMYYFVQTIRYFIYGISGCGPGFHTSWASVVFVWVWPPIIDCFAAYYAIVLIIRLFRYRSQFSRLISAQNTTRSRFVRLFILSFLLVFCTLPVQVYILYDNSRALDGEPYDWNVVHEHTGDTVLYVPSLGQVRYEDWIRVAAGFLIFCFLGTGTDAGGLYKGLMAKLGLGKVVEAWDSSTETLKMSWFTFSDKTKSAWKSKGSHASSSAATVVEEPKSAGLSNTSTTDSILKHPVTAHIDTKKPSFFRRFFQYSSARPNILPVSVVDTTDTPGLYFPKSAKAARADGKWRDSDQSTSQPRLDIALVSGSPGVVAHAWSTERSPSTANRTDENVVTVRHEVVIESEKDRIEGEIV